MTLGLIACAKEYPPPPPRFGVPDPQPDVVESVVFLIGDAGYATTTGSPVLRVLRDEVERWAGGLSRDTSVYVLWLGDNIYPRGLRDETDPGRTADSTHLQAQIDVVAGENAKRRNARAIFIAGNHDWGHMPGERGRARLDNMGRFIARRSRAQSLNADLLPRASDPAPGVLDIGGHLRVILFDTAWWLLEADVNEKARVMQIVERYMGGAQGRSLMLAAHHPWSSGSAHGGLVPFWGTIGVKWLLARSGAALQDVNSLPYRDLKNQLTLVFQRTATPLIWAGGHDHALQVIEGIQPTDPRFNIVSGSGSKISRVGRIPGMLFHRAEPGFMRLVVMQSGAINLFMVSAPGEYLECTGTGTVQSECMDRAVRAFKTVYSARLKQ
jgi:hypothetical protein